MKLSRSFTTLVSDFAERHGIADLAAEDNAAALDADSFDAALETLVNQAETWRRILADFRPVARAAAERAEVTPQFGASGFVQV